MSFKIGDHGPALKPFQEFLNRKFSSYSHLNIDLYYGLDEAKVVAEAMRRYGMAPTFMTINLNGVPTRVEGAIATDEFLSRANYRPNRPIIFSVEGHMSNMFAGPAADTAMTLEKQGVCWHQPTGYNNSALPFDNQSGIDELMRLVGSNMLFGPNGELRPFPPGTPWGVTGFSQGAMIVSDFMMQHVLPANGVLNWRLNDFRKGLAFGNPRREKDKCCSWATNPPSPGTQGIMDVLFNTSKTVIADRWQERAAHGDLFAENTDDAAGKDKTAIARIVCENEWVGGETSLFIRVLKLFGNPVGGSLAALKASFEAIKFLAANPNPHYSTVSEPGDVEWMRGV